MNTIQLMTMLRLQNDLNTHIDPNWVESNHDWVRAIHAESIELLDHVGWKWWKQQTLDQAQVDLELVDIWHFILSLMINDCEGNIQRAGLLLSEAWGLDLASLPVSKNVNADLAEAIGLAFREHSLQGIVVFRAALNRLGMTDERLYTMYLAKNVLNLFRQEHGYKEGTYIKKWDGKEDNEVLADLMAREPDHSPADLRMSLEAAYTRVI